MPRFTIIRTLLAGLLMSAAASAEIPDNAIWIDVRSPSEYAEGHLEQAKLIPFDGIAKGVLTLGIAKDAPIYLYCGSGARAEKAKAALKVQGFTRVTNVGRLEDARSLAAGSP